VRKKKSWDAWTRGRPVTPGAQTGGNSAIQERAAALDYDCRSFARWWRRQGYGSKLGRAGIPVKPLVTLALVRELKASSNVRRSVIIRPKDGEDHFSAITAHERDLRSYVPGGKRPSGTRAVARRRDDFPRLHDKMIHNGTAARA
jgi:hypothetical protein